MKRYLDALLRYGVERALIGEDDRVFAMNRLLEILGLDEPGEESEGRAPEELAEILGALCDDACRRGRIEDGTTARDLLDTALMGALTPFPREVRARFDALYAQDPAAATDWFYRFSGDVNYIRRDRIARDESWDCESEYGRLRVTINLSKPEKDPRAIAAARFAQPRAYPRCALCAENEGYAGRLDHPARQNLRTIPLRLDGESWFFQYSPYVYYPEHCIVFCGEHRPMKIDEGCLRRLLDFVTLFPHYFLGSNADLPVIGGSILSHDHFQGGRFDFPMAAAPVETPLRFAGFSELEAGIVRWPMAVLRLRGADRGRLTALGAHILSCWRGYSDPAASLFAETEGQAHHSVTPIARRRGTDYELDLVLRSNYATPGHPLGLFHPHEELHHIKKENIGLIEVMGLAVLPARLKGELRALGEALCEGRTVADEPALQKHAAWAEELRARHRFTKENAQTILREELGLVFQRVLTDAGVFRRDAPGREAFLRFAAAAGGRLG